MCRNDDTIPTPASKMPLPNRHQIRNLIRKTARTMRTKSNGTVTNGTMESWIFVERCMVDYRTAAHKGEMSWSDYDRAWAAVEKAAKTSTFFSKEEGLCGSVKLTLRKSAQL